MSRRADSPLQYFPADYFRRLDFAGVFARPAPVEVDIGCGDGAFLVGRAEAFPGRNFLGIERLLGRVRKTCRRAERRALTNLRVLRLESGYAVEWLLPRGSVAVFHLLFPDPWPKRRHWQNRVFQPPFLRSLHAALAPGGEVRIKTDDAHYFAHMRAVFEADSSFREMPWPEDEPYPPTDFEGEFLEKKLPIHRARLVKV
jgi:tRNA (guanine-N7-)-methyltransferase